jgi:hypothetical protein
MKVQKVEDKVVLIEEMTDVVAMIEEAVEEVEMTVEAVVAVEEDKNNVKICKYENLQIINNKNKNVQCTEIGTLAYFQIGKLKKDVITEKITTQENTER